MITKQDILKMARQVFNHSQGKKRPEIIQPVRDWYIGLSVFVLVSVIGGLWVWSQYSFYEGLSPVGGEVAMTLEQYRAPAAEAAVERFQERQQMYDSLVNAAPLGVLPPKTETKASSSATEVNIQSASSSEPVNDNEAPASPVTSETTTDTEADAQPEAIDLTQPLIGQ